MKTRLLSLFALGALCFAGCAPEPLDLCAGMTYVPAGSRIVAPSGEPLQQKLPDGRTIEGREAVLPRPMLILPPGARVISPRPMPPEQLPATNTCPIRKVDTWYRATTPREVPALSSGVKETSL